MHRALGGFQFGGLTATAGTAITALVPPHSRGYSRITKALYRPGATGHALVFLKSFGSAELTAAVAASGTSITLDRDPGGTTGTPDEVAAPCGAIANGDWLCIELDDGSYFLTTLSSLSTLTMTVNALPSAAAAGNKVWTFGVPGDHPVSSQTAQKPNPIKGFTITTTASVMNEFSDTASGILQSLAPNMPLMVHSANGTNAGVLELLSGSYTQA